MNILMISDVYFPRVNGVSTSIATTRSTLHGLGHRTTLVAPVYPGHTESDSTIRRIDARKVLFDPEDFLMKQGSLERFLNTLNASSYDIIHVHTPFMAHHCGVALSRRLDIPLVETYHTHFEEYVHHYIPLMPRGMGRLLARSVARHIANGVDGLVSPSKAMARSLQGYGVDVPIRVVPTGLDLDEFVPGDRLAFCRRFGVDPQRPSLVYVGRVAYEKNIALLVDVVEKVKKKLPRILLIIAGEGPAKKSLEDLCVARGLADNVLFVGYLDRGPRLWDCFCAGDLFAFASKTETQGLVLLEAMALGVPVVGYAEMGASEIMTADAGCIVIEGDADVFADSVVGVLNDRDRRIALGDKGRRYVRSWSTQAMTERLIDFYKWLIAEAAVCGNRALRAR